MIDASVAVQVEKQKCLKQTLFIDATVIVSILQSIYRIINLRVYIHILLSYCKTRNKKVLLLQDFETLYFMYYRNFELVHYRKKNVQQLSTRINFTSSCYRFYYYFFHYCIFLQIYNFEKVLQ